MELENKIEELLKEYNLVVLKGIKLDGVNSEISKLINKDSKMQYYYENIFSQKRRVLYYDEYLILKEFLKGSNNNRIAILNNNLYISYYPLFSNIEEKILETLLNNDIEDTEVKYIEEKSLDKDIRTYTTIFSSVIKLDNEYYCIYNEDIDKYDDIEEIEEEYFNLYDEENFSFGKSSNKKYEIFEVVEEIDYLHLLKRVDSIKESIYLDISWNEEEVEKKINILNNIYNLQIEVYSKEEKELPKYTEVYNILKKYWGFSSFRELPLYDAEKVEEGIKEVYSLSQENIINTIINESENAYRSYGRDVFVTAPTGAGKSVMFQIPAIYLTERYEGVVIVISPLIGLMQDQVDNLKNKGYQYVRTLNSEISLTEKNEILEEIKDGTCKILYISPETLIGNSMLDSILSNDKKLALLVIDEAHIVTTWGKQFRPDYWYLGDYITKIRRKYQKQDGHSFIIATFTATATYGGEENMFEETKSSLNMSNPHKYFGFIKRDDIEFNIIQAKAKTNKQEYRKDKYELLMNHIKRCLFYKKKCLIYFPTVALIEDFKTYLCLYNYDKKVVTYYATMKKNDKKESGEHFRNGEVKIMLATKAFGMGIDINDIEVIIHFAPTGNVCDYLQEVGRAARKEKLLGTAIYDFMSNDFKYINRFHGISTLKKYQLVEVIKKIYSIYIKERQNNESKFYIKKRNELLLDVEIFSHIFNNPMLDDNDDILNKVKTALLIIQKDFENTKKYSPFKMRPIPLFSKGYFKVDKALKELLSEEFSSEIFEAEKGDIYKVNLKRIWEDKFSNKYSFPQFKYYLYTKDNEKIKNENLLNLISCLKVEVFYEKRYEQVFSKIIKIFEDVIYSYLLKGQYLDKDILKNEFINKGIRKFQAEVIAESLLQNIILYEKRFYKSLNISLVKTLTDNDGTIRYSFYNSIDEYLKWVKNGIKDINNRLEDGIMYLDNFQKQQEIIQLLGIYEVMELLTFKSLGGLGGEIYIYVNETKTMEQVIRKPYLYRNTILEKVEKRHILNVAMLNYLYSSGFSSKEIWDIIENYFIGVLPEKVLNEYSKKIVNLS